MNFQEIFEDDETLTTEIQADEINEFCINSPSINEKL